MKKLIFFKQGSFSNTNDSVINSLRKMMPNIEIIVFDINQIVRKHLSKFFLTNFLELVKKYGLEIIIGKRELEESFWQTAYIFQKVRNLVRDIHKDIKPDFSFQTQSIFDCSNPGTPHFVYTDHTYETRKEYPCHGQFYWSSTRPNWLINLEAEIYANAQIIFTMSNNISQVLSEKYKIPNSKIVKVNCGCNVPPEELLKIPITINRYKNKKILFVGKEWDRKGGPELIKAFSILKRLHPSAQLIICGCTPKIRESNVEIVGKIPLEKVILHYAQSSIFCLPSKQEPFGIVWLEAMLSGLPIIALSLGAAKDFVIEKKTGLLVIPNDIDDLAKAMTYYIENPQFALACAQNGRTFVTNEYSWEKTCSQIANKITPYIL